MTPRPLDPGAIGQIAEQAIDLYEQYRSEGQSPAFAKYRASLGMMTAEINRQLEQASYPVLRIESRRLTEEDPVCSQCGGKCPHTSGMRSRCCDAIVISGEIISEAMNGRR